MTSQNELEHLTTFSFICSTTFLIFLLAYKIRTKKWCPPKITAMITWETPKLKSLRFSSLRIPTTYEKVHLVIVLPGCNRGKWKFFLESSDPLDCCHAWVDGLEKDVPFKCEIFLAFSIPTTQWRWSVYLAIQDGIHCPYIVMINTNQSSEASTNTQQQKGQPKITPRKTNHVTWNSFTGKRDTFYKLSISIWFHVSFLGVYPCYVLGYHHGLIHLTIFADLFHIGHKILHGSLPTRLE